MNTITWQRMRQQQEPKRQQQALQQEPKRQQQGLQLELELEQALLLLFCRKRTKQLQR
jgi:hypothetical protein